MSGERGRRILRGDKQLPLFHASHQKQLLDSLLQMDGPQERSTRALRATSGRCLGKSRLQSMMAQKLNNPPKFWIFGWRYGVNLNRFTTIGEANSLTRAIGSAKSKPNRYYDIVYVQDTKSGRCWQIHPSEEEMQYAEETGYL